MTRRSALLHLANAAATACAQRLPDLYTHDGIGDPPFLLEPGWTMLLNGKDLAGWHAQTSDSAWYTARGVEWRRIFNPTQLTAKAAPGDRLVNAKGRTSNLVTDRTFGDVELYLEFLLAKGSNSGVYMHGLYEVQIFDSFGYTGPLTAGDCGGIYGYEGSSGGSPPLRNAARPPGEWQSFHIWSQAPRFASATKAENARFLRVLLNGVLVQSEFEVRRPTQSAMSIGEAPENPIMLQGDHGPAAFRNICYRPLAIS
jgi:hypothetical protein